MCLYHVCTMWAWAHYGAVATTPVRALRVLFGEGVASSNKLLLVFLENRSDFPATICHPQPTCTHLPRGNNAVTPFYAAEPLQAPSHASGDTKQTHARDVRHNSDNNAKAQGNTTGHAITPHPNKHSIDNTALLCMHCKHCKHCMHAHGTNIVVLDTWHATVATQEGGTKLGATHVQSRRHTHTTTTTTTTTTSGCTRGRR